MSILQPMPVFSDVAPTYCGFGGSKTLWANGGFNFELTAGSTGFDVGDAREVVPWNSPWQSGFNDVLYDGWTAYPLMALGNGAGGPPAGYAVRTPGTADDSTARDSLMHAKYTVSRTSSYQRPSPPGTSPPMTSRWDRSTTSCGAGSYSRTR